MSLHSRHRPRLCQIDVGRGSISCRNPRVRELAAPGQHLFDHCDPFELLAGDLDETWQRGWSPRTHPGVVKNLGRGPTDVFAATYGVELDDFLVPSGRGPRTRCRTGSSVRRSSGNRRSPDEGGLEHQEGAEQEDLRFCVRAAQGMRCGISSIEGLSANPHIPAYCASKAGLLGMTRSMAAQLGPLGIRINAVCPASFRRRCCRWRWTSTKSEPDSSRRHRSAGSVSPVKSPMPWRF